MVLLHTKLRTVACAAEPAQLHTHAINASLDLDTEQHPASEPVHFGNPHVSGLTMRQDGRTMLCVQAPSDYNVRRMLDNTKQRRCRAIPWSRKAKLAQDAKA